MPHLKKLCKNCRNSELEKHHSSYSPDFSPTMSFFQASAQTPFKQFTSSRNLEFYVAEINLVIVGNNVDIKMVLILMNNF